MDRYEIQMERAEPTLFDQWTKGVGRQAAERRAAFSSASVGGKIAMLFTREAPAPYWMAFYGVVGLGVYRAVVPKRRQ